MRPTLLAVWFAGVFLAGCSSAPTLVPPSPTSVPIPAATVPPPTPTPVVANLKQLVAVAFSSPLQGWIAGGDCDGSRAVRCSIIATSDGGLNWTEQTHTTSTIEELVFVDAAHGWALGRSTAGCSGPTQACPSILLSTVDGGKTWTEKEIEKSGWSNLSFINPNDGWAIATSCTVSGAGTRCNASLRRSGDGGASWSPSPIPGLVPTGIGFVDPKHGWAVGWGCNETGAGGCRATILVTRDAGKNWFRQLQADETLSTSSPQVGFFDLQSGWWISGGPSGCTQGGCWPSLYRTTDGGRMYNRIQRPNAWKLTGDQGVSGSPGKIQFANSNVGWMTVSAGAGPGMGGLAQTTDGGKSWTRRGGTDGWDLAGMSILSAKDVWVAGTLRSANPAAALLLHTSDGGQNWNTVLPR